MRSLLPVVLALVACSEPTPPGPTATVARFEPGAARNPQRAGLGCMCLEPEDVLPGSLSVAGRIDACRRRVNRARAGQGPTHENDHW